MVPCSGCRTFLLLPLSVHVVADLAVARGVDPSDVRRVVLAHCENDSRQRFGIAQSRDGCVVQVRSSTFCLSAVLSQVMEKRLEAPGRDFYELPSDIVRGWRADGSSLQDLGDAEHRLWLAGGRVIFAGSWRCLAFGRTIHRLREQTMLRASARWS